MTSYTSNYFDTLRDKLLSILSVPIEFCYVYDTQEESLNLLMHDHLYDKKYVYHDKELDQIMHEIALSEIMISQHQEMLGSLQCIVCTFDKVQIFTFPLQNGARIIAFYKMKLYARTTAESDLLICKLQHIISEYDMTPEH